MDNADVKGSAADASDAYGSLITYAMPAPSCSLQALGWMSDQTTHGQSLSALGYTA